MVLWFSACQSGYYYLFFLERESGGVFRQRERERVSENEEELDLGGRNRKEFN